MSNENHNLQHIVEEDGTVSILDSVPFTKASRVGSVAGLAALAVVSPMSIYFLTDWIAYRKESTETLNRIEVYIAGAQERGRALMATTQRHEIDIQDLKLMVNSHGNRITAIEAIGRNREQRP